MTTTNSFTTFLASWLLIFPVFAGDKPPKTVKKTNIHTWESVGEILENTGKIISVRQTLKLSDETWSLLPGAVSSAAQLTDGDQIHVKGSSLPDGTYETHRIFLIHESDSQKQAAGRSAPVQGADHGAVDSKTPPNIAYGGDPRLEGPDGRVPGRESRVPPTGRPRGSGPEVGGLQSSSGVLRPRFLPGDAEGIVNHVTREQLLLTQTLYFDKDSTIVGTDGQIVKGKDLHAGQRVAITIKDEVDSKTQSRKAAVIRLLP